MTRDPVLKDGEKVARAESRERRGYIRSVYSSSVSMSVYRSKREKREGNLSPVPSSYVSVDFAVRCAA